MKFMKLGSKPDSFLTDGDNSRYVATELATDIVITVGNVKFYLHKFTLLSKCSRLQKLFATTNEDTDIEIEIQDIPGGPAAFEICAKFCYGITVTLNAYNVAAARCAAEYLEMYETAEKGNLIYKIDVFLNSSILHNWKDSIIVLRSTGSLQPWSDELKLVSHCLDSIASKASVDSSKVEWSYTYNRSKLPSHNGFDPHWSGGRKHQMVPKDWWVDDLCELDIDLYKRAITSIKSRDIVSDNVIGEALSTYAIRRLPGFSKGLIQSSDVNQSIVKTIVWLLPAGKGSVPCSFLLMLLKVAISLECGECEKSDLMKRIGQQLEEATVTDLLILGSAGEKEIYDVAAVMTLLEEFSLHIQRGGNGTVLPPQCELPEVSTPGHASDASKMMVAKLIDGYLAEVARDANLPLSKFVDLAEMVSGFPRPSHDGLYRGIDMYLKGHPGMSKSERKRLCRLMDCKKLSREARMHAVQNERLPLRIIVQVLFFEQVRATASSSGSSTPELQGSLRLLLPGGPNRSSRSPAAEDWDNVANTEDVRALRGELASLRLGGGLGLGGSSSDRHGSVGAKVGTDKVAENKLKGMVMSKMLTKLWSGKERGEYSSSDTSESPGSGNAEETKSNPSRSRSSVS